MSDIYQVKYVQRKKENDAWVQITNELYTDNNVYVLNPLNNAWNSNGCYCGAIARNNSIIGTCSKVEWTGWKNDRVNSDMRDCQISYSPYTNQQNLRFMIKFVNGAYTNSRLNFKWTGLREETVSSIENSIESQSNISVYDPYTRRYKNSSTSGWANNPLNVAPLNSLKVNELVFLPIFTFREVEYYNYNSETGLYSNIVHSSNVQIQRLYWKDIKPEDNTEQGQYYDDDLYLNGYKEIQAVNADGRRFKYCCGVTLIPYYGKSSSVYDVNTDSYVDSINPDDGNEYGLREIFGTIISDTDTFPIIGTTNLNRPCLSILTETYDSNDNSITYSSPTGISFSNFSTNPLTYSDYSLNPNWSISSNLQSFSTDTYYTPFWSTNNSMYSNTYVDQNPNEPYQESPTLTVQSTKLEVDGSTISTIDATGYNFNGTPNCCYYNKSTRTVSLASIAYFSVEELWHTIASLGCYVADDVLHAQYANLGKYIGENNHIYLGKMDSNGITDGTFIQGSDISDSEQSNIDDIIQGTPYIPVNPTKHDDNDDPDREDINPPNREGDDIPLHLDNRFGLFNGFLTMYNLTESELSNFGSALMGNPLNYRGNFEKDLSQELSGTYDVSSILNYIVSVKMYPFSVATLPNTTVLGNTNVYMGTGEFGIPIGTQCRKLTSSISVLDAGQLDVKPLTPYKDFRDYYNTTIVCYMPYCGCVELNPMDIMNTVLHCYYLIDFLTGDCSAVLYSIGANNINYPVAIANGNIGVDIPLSANNTGQLEAVKRMQNSAKAHTIVSYINAGIETAENLLSIGSFDPQDVSDVAGVVDIFSNAVTSFTNIWAENNANPYGANQSARSAVATPIMPMGSGATNFMLSNSVYLQIRRGTYSKPKNYARTMGYPTTFSDRLSNVHGLTYCSGVEVNGINCTQEERALIKSALEGGTILP